MNPALKGHEVSELLSTAGCRDFAIAGAGSYEMVSAAAPGGAISAQELVSGSDGSGPDNELIGSDEDDALVLFTSGTTGLPKAVGMSHGTLWRRLVDFAIPFDPAAPPIMGMMCVPYFHVGGSLGLLASFYSGNATVVQTRFEAGRWIDLVEGHGVVRVFLVPTMLQRILDHPDFDPERLRSLQAIAYGAAAAPVELVRRAMEALPWVAFANVFGQTETLGAYTTLLPEDHQRPDRIGSVGKPLPGSEVRIVVPGTEDPVAPGEVGELMVLSTQNVVDGWLRTGDLAWADADGYIYPAGRLSDTINRGGEKFGPIEVETVMRDHPAVVDVAVVGVADSEMGERVGAIVVSDGPLTATELQEFCRERLARFKNPERIAFVAEIPYNDTGKVNRRAVRELLTSAAGAERKE
jgi:long-chain acyl-CoA synthetase